MTTRDYQRFARVIRRNLEAVANGDESEVVFDMIETLAREIADEFEDDNPNFDRRLFYEACGCEPSPTAAELRYLRNE